jgi:hypothetical protein
VAGVADGGWDAAPATGGFDGGGWDEVPAGAADGGGWDTAVAPVEPAGAAQSFGEYPAAQANDFGVGY